MALGSQKWKGHWADLVMAPSMMRMTAAVLRVSGGELRRVEMEADPRFWWRRTKPARRAVPPAMVMRRACEAFWRDCVFSL